MITDFYSYISERQSITDKRNAGQLKPWTDDEILQKWKFCSVIRDDDLSSQWFITNLKQHYKDDLKGSLWVAVLFRWFNIPSTGDTLVNNNLVEDWCPIRAEQEIAKQGKFSSPAYRTAAYKIGKLKGVIKVIDIFHQNLDTHVSELKKCKDWGEAHKYLTTILYFGPFNTYQFLLDLMRTEWDHQLGNPRYWCIAGPGAIRGLNWIHNRSVDTTLNATEAYNEIYKLYTSRPITHNRLIVSDIQHNLCEWDKYNRVLNGGKLKCKYEGA